MIQREPEVAAERDRDVAADAAVAGEQAGRRAELGEITAASMLPVSRTADDIGIIVAGGTGTHSVYVPMSGHVRSVTKEIC